MTDRELLEDAAKAAGLTLGAWSDNYGAFMYRGVEPVSYTHLTLPTNREV